MRLIKTFGLAMLAAVAAMAFVGATSAMAESTTLCESDTAELGCQSPATQASHVHFTTLTGAKAELLSSIGDVECDVLYLGLTLGLAAPLVIHGNFTYSNCFFNGSVACTVTEVSSSALFNFLKIGVDEAEVTLTVEIKFDCAGWYSCVDSGTGLKFHGLSALGNGHVGEVVKQTVTKVSGFLCPKTATLDLAMGSLTSLYIRN